MQISVPQSGTLDPNSPKLLWSTDGAANESPLVYQPASDRWVASTGPLLCNANVVWSVEVANDEGLSFALGPFSGVVADSSDVAFEDDFETNQGWTVSALLPTAVGLCGVPITDCDRGNPTNTPNGTSACYLTDNSNNGDCNSDVDGAIPF